MRFVQWISFVIFNAADMSQAFSDIGGMFGIGGIPFTSAELVYYLKNYGITLILALIGATPLPKKLAGSIASKKWGNTVISVAEPLVLAILLVIPGSRDVKVLIGVPLVVTFIFWIVFRQLLDIYFPEPLIYYLFQ